MYAALLNYMGHGSVDTLPTEHLKVIAHLAMLQYRSSHVFVSPQRARRMAGLPPRPAPPHPTQPAK